MDTILTPSALKQGVNLTRQVHKILRRLIVEVQFLPNQTISDREIASQLGISKTPVREAIIRLEDEGLVKVVPKSRTYVVPISLERFHEGFYMRKTMELAAARDAAQYRSFEDACRLEAFLTKQRDAADSKAYWDFFTLDEQFHAAIFQAAGVAGVWDMVNAAKVEIDRVRSLKLVFGVRQLERVISQHEAIASAIVDRNLDAATEAMQVHMGSVESKVGDLASDSEFWDFFERVNSGKESPEDVRDAMASQNSAPQPMPEGETTH